MSQCPTSYTMENRIDDFTKVLEEDEASFSKGSDSYEMPARNFCDRISPTEQKDFYRYLSGNNEKLLGEFMEYMDPLDLEKLFMF